MKKFLLLLLPIFLLTMSCGEDITGGGDPEPEPPLEEDLTDTPYNPVEYTLTSPEGFPNIDDFIPLDNPLTQEGVELGRRLFYDPILSLDSTLSCSSCHLQGGTFTDNVDFSTGVLGELTARSSMSLINVAYYNNGLFWDGRIQSLEDQALLPVEDLIELHEKWPNVEAKLQRHSDYPQRFRKAFGIEKKEEITRDLTVKAIAQFERTLVSGNSRYDKVRRGELFPSDSEANGALMFFDNSNGELPDAECAHCHNDPLFTTNEYFNNGLDAAENFDDFTDLGLGAVTGRPSDNGKFRAPTLRNIALTAPYMHDGRFQTLEEVIDHYNSGGHPADNKDPLITPLGLSEENKQDLINFLHSLTDEEFINNPEFSNPFE